MQGRAGIRGDWDGDGGGLTDGRPDRPLSQKGTGPDPLAFLPDSVAGWGTGGGGGSGVGAKTRHLELNIGGVKR